MLFKNEEPILILLKIAYPGKIIFILLSLLVISNFLSWKLIIPALPSMFVCEAYLTWVGN
jgi:hypothetical protein